MNHQPASFQPIYPCGHAAALALQMGALSHPARIVILQYLAGVEACCCKDVVEQFDLAQSTVSQHLKVLVDAGLVRLTPERQRSRYEIDRNAFGLLADAMSRLLVSSGTCPVSPTSG